MNAEPHQEFNGLPGADLVLKGLKDLERGSCTEYALLVLVAETRLRRLGVVFPPVRPGLSGPIEHALYDCLCTIYQEGAYSRYNSLLRRLNSFAQALERENAVPK